MSPDAMLKLERSGKFKASSMIPNRHKCGSMSSVVYSYTVKIEATNRKLTVEGFVMNNELISTYFLTRFGSKAPKWDAISCEMMAVTAAKELADQICSEGVDCRKVDVSIRGSNGAMITASWTVPTQAG